MADNDSPPIYVRDERAMRRLAGQLLRQPAIAVDCEANTLFAYDEKLCLLQISTKSRDYIVDPLVDLDVAPLAPVFADSAITKIFHSAEYDVLLLKRQYPFEFRALFDTKVAALSLGVPSPGLASVLADWMGVKLDKRFQRSDWGRRPLSEGQLDYARRDTCYLIELATRMREQLAAAGSPHVEEVAAECRRLETLEPDPRVYDPDDFIRIKGVNKLDPEQRRALKELCRMRNDLARERDLPPFKVLTNDMLFGLAQSRPKSVERLRDSDRLSPKLVGRYGEAIVDAVKVAAKARPIKRLPTPQRAPEDELQGERRQRYEALRRWRKTAAEARGTDASLVLSRAAMLELACLEVLPKDRTQLASTTHLEGWRVEHYGDAILETLERRSAARAR